MPIHGDVHLKILRPTIRERTDVNGPYQRDELRLKIIIEPGPSAEVASVAPGVAEVGSRKSRLELGFLGPTETVLSGSRV